MWKRREKKRKEHTEHWKGLLTLPIPKSLLDQDCSLWSALLNYCRNHNRWIETPPPSRRVALSPSGGLRILLHSFRFHRISYFQNLRKIFSIMGSRWLDLGTWCYPSHGYFQTHAYWVSAWEAPNARNRMSTIKKASMGTRHIMYSYKLKQFYYED
jgi:hypothetical protein